MQAEKDIVNFWLNRKGFSTISSISVGSNREINFIAIDEKAKLIWHVEVASSVTMKRSEIIERFLHRSIQKKVKDLISSYKDLKYEDVLITSSGKRYDGVKTINMSDILVEVMQNLSTYNYKNDSIRTLQLVKYLVLAKQARIDRINAKKNFTQKTLREL